jgi:hypothetical protein
VTAAPERISGHATQCANVRLVISLIGGEIQDRHAERLCQNGAPDRLARLVDCKAEQARAEWIIPNMFTYATGKIPRGVYYFGLG